MSKTVIYNRHVVRDGEVICDCDGCNTQTILYFLYVSPGSKLINKTLKNRGWVQKKSSGDWYDFCSNQCYNNWLKENTKGDNNNG